MLELIVIKNQDIYQVNKKTRNSLFLMPTNFDKKFNYHLKLDSINSLQLQRNISVQEKLEESIKEAEEIKKLPKEEQEKHFIPAEKVFEELGYVDERTEEEKERDKMLNRKSMALNGLMTYRALRQVYNELE